MLPALGPSSLRDAGGLLFDNIVYSYVTHQIYNSFDMKDSDKEILSATVTSISFINTRSVNAFRYYKSGSPFEYDLVRLIYLTKREIQISK